MIVIKNSIYGKNTDRIMIASSDINVILDFLQLKIDKKLNRIKDSDLKNLGPYDTGAILEVLRTKEQHTLRMRDLNTLRSRIVDSYNHNNNTIISFEVGYYSVYTVDQENLGII